MITWQEPPFWNSIKLSGNWDRIESNEIEVEGVPLLQQKYHPNTELIFATTSIFGKLFRPSVGPDSLVSSSSSWYLIPWEKPEGQAWANI